MALDFHLVLLQLRPLRVSLCQLSSSFQDVGLSAHLLSENGPSRGMSRPRPAPLCFPAGLPSCSLLATCLILLEHSYLSSSPFLST